MSNIPKMPVRKSLHWNDDLLARFNKLKLLLSSEPVLQLPNLHLPFVLRTDASNHELGVVLLQYHEDYPHPAAYASKEILDRGGSYSTIERVCLAVVLGIPKIDYSLLSGYGFCLRSRPQASNIPRQD